MHPYKNYYDLKKEYDGINYIMSRRLNSDVLENLYSYLKGMVGSNTHMTPIEFKYWLVICLILKVKLIKNINLFSLTQ